MQDDTIHSHKPLIEHLANLSFVLGIIAIIIFVLSLISKKIPFFLDDITIITICMIGSIISSTITIAVTIVDHRSFIGYHFRAIAGFILSLLPFIISVVIGLK